jgi:hypothetical protein
VTATGRATPKGRSKDIHDKVGGHEKVGGAGGSRTFSMKDKSDEI